MGVANGLNNISITARVVLLGIVMLVAAGVPAYLYLDSGAGDASTVVIAALVVAVLLFFFIASSVNAGIQQIQKNVHRIQQDIPGAVEGNSNPQTDIGQINKSLAQLATQYTTTRSEYNSVNRVKRALDNSSTCFMIADTNRDIVYVNQAAQVLLKEAEQSIRQDLPHFNAEQLLGESIDSFHKNPAHQRNLLDSINDTYETRLSLGDWVFKLILNPIADDDGAVLGHSVEWHNITDILESERLTTRIIESLNCTTTNVMIADADRKIIYLNRSVEAMLKSVEADLRKVLPHFEADKILGSNMDIFHKNPAHQSQLLASLTQTYRTEIQVGNRHFRLIANPIVAKDGERLGSVVEWLDRTTEVEAEHEITQLVEGAVRGDFSNRASTQSKDGFQLMLAQGLNKLITITEQGLIEISNVLQAMSKGDLTKRIERDFEGLFDQLKTYTNDTSINLAEMIGQIRAASETINNAASEIATGNSDLSNRTEQQASNLEETASSMEELTSTVQLNADNAKQANILASDAAQVASNGGTLIEQVVGTMGDINNSARKIEDIIGVIDGIAFQTNILALNAAVEAARAGEQGRGFAVVASEVRTLAQRSANAAKDIKDLISDSVEKVDSGNKLVNQSGETMKEIVTAIQRVNDIMSEIASASIEQASGIDEVNRAVTQMDEMTQQNAALVEEAAAAAESMSNQASQLISRVNTFILDEHQQNKLTAERAVPPRSVKPTHRVSAGATVTPKVSPKPTPDKAPKASIPSDDDDEWESF